MQEDTPAQKNTVGERRGLSTRIRRTTFSDEERSEILKLLLTRIDNRTSGRRQAIDGRHRKTELEKTKRLTMNKTVMAEQRRRKAENARRRRANMSEEELEEARRKNKERGRVRRAKKQLTENFRAPVPFGTEASAQLPVNQQNLDHHIQDPRNELTSDEPERRWEMEHSKNKFGLSSDEGYEKKNVKFDNNPYDTSQPKNLSLDPLVHISGNSDQNNKPDIYSLPTKNYRSNLGNPDLVQKNYFVNYNPYLQHNNALEVLPNKYRRSYFSSCNENKFLHDLEQNRSNVLHQNDATNCNYMLLSNYIKQNEMESCKSENTSNSFEKNQSTVQIFPSANNETVSHVDNFNSSQMLQQTQYNNRELPSNTTESVSHISVLKEHQSWLYNNIGSNFIGQNEQTILDENRRNNFDYNCYSNVFQRYRLQALSDRLHRNEGTRQTTGIPEDRMMQVATPEHNTQLYKDQCQNESDGFIPHHHHIQQLQKTIKHNVFNLSENNHEKRQSVNSQKLVGNNQRNQEIISEYEIPLIRSSSVSKQNTGAAKPSGENSVTNLSFEKSQFQGGQMMEIGVSHTPISKDQPPPQINSYNVLSSTSKYNTSDVKVHWTEMDEFGSYDEPKLTKMSLSEDISRYQQTHSKAHFDQCKPVDSKLQLVEHCAFNSSCSNEVKQSVINQGEEVKTNSSYDKLSQNHAHISDSAKCTVPDTTDKLNDSFINMTKVESTQDQSNTTKMYKLHDVCIGKDDRKLECEGDIKEFFTEASSFPATFQELHMEDKMIYACEPCELLFYSRELYNKHRKKKHSDKNHSEGKKVRWEMQLKSSGNNVYICRFCATVFKAKKFLQKHIKSKHSDQTLTKKEARVKKFVCGVCDRRFVFAHLLQDHVNSHTGATPYACVVCGSRYSMRSELMCHAKTHRQTGNPPP
ncbi:uncharacterized protein [Periplaneta americana]|uniref:uncharacterized protein n=1 Tax=Periplaneta americana TaxID=6978 RepID=UPI0037E87A9E